MFLALHYLARRRVLVNTIQGKTLDAILYRQVGPLLVLRDVSMIAPDGKRVPLDGEVVLERSRVEFFQVVGA